MKSSVATIYEGFVGKHPTNNALFDELWGAGAERVGFDYPYSGARVAPAAAPKVADGRLLSAMVGMFQQLCELALGRPRGRYNNGYEPCVNPEEYGFPKELLRAILPGLELLETLIFGVHSYLGAEGGGEQLPYAGASRTHGAAVSATGALSEVAAALARLVGADGCSVYVAAASGGSAQPVCIGTHCEDGCSPGLGEQAPAPVYWTLRDAAAWQEGIVGARTMALSETMTWSCCCSASRSAAPRSAPTRATCCSWVGQAMARLAADPTSCWRCAPKNPSHLHLALALFQSVGSWATKPLRGYFSP